MKQLLLFADARPLEERLGRDFFRQLPQTPGVYLMRDSSDRVLYVGKARNLRKRLGCYRRANPDRMPPRQLRLVSAVCRIELEQCADEAAALAREAQLLLALRPKFNRIGVWPPTPRFVAWQTRGQDFVLQVLERAEADASAGAGWQVFGPFGGSVFGTCQALARLIWWACNVERGFAAMPAGWLRGAGGNHFHITCGSRIDEVAAQVEKLRRGQAELFCQWVLARQPAAMKPFERAALEVDLERIARKWVLPN